MTKQSNQAPDDTTRIGDADAALRRILRTAPQDLWLDTIRRADMTRHADLIHWMLNRTECDFAVAVHAFYHSDPVSHLTDPLPLPQRPDTTQHFATILRNWDTGFYRNHRLGLNDQDVDPRLIRRVNQKLLAWPRGALPFHVPPKFLDLTGGAPIDLPTHLDPNEARHLWQLYRTLGLRVRRSAPGLPRRFARVGKALGRINFQSARR
ncbi:hypothetical protein [Yoonia sp. 2307UL14-13]|uniref:hypothetical protein n=1 Tax=Yoonia sp. 2307UL14-13 TaxID=3126506 RepID=UPI0030ABB0B0